MKIGVISDTHGVVSAWLGAMKQFEGADLIIHAGDVLYHPPRMLNPPGYELPELARLMNECAIPIVVVRGNCDSEVYEELLQTPVQNPYALVQINQTRIVVSHGHLFDRDGMIRLGKQFKADIFISGHTHIPVIDDVGGLILLNPGSAAFPKYERNGKPVASVGIITDDHIQVVSVEDGSVLLEMPLAGIA